MPSDMEGIYIEHVRDDIGEFALEVSGYVFILMLELEAVFAPSVEELVVDVLDNLFEGILEVFWGGALEDIVLEEVAYAEEDAFRGGVDEVVLGWLDTFGEVFRFMGEVGTHVCHGEGPEEFGEVVSLEEVGVIVVVVILTGGSLDLEIEFDEGII